MQQSKQGICSVSQHSCPTVLANETTNGMPLRLCEAHLRIWFEYFPGLTKPLGQVESVVFQPRSFLVLPQTELRPSYRALSLRIQYLDPHLFSFPLPNRLCKWSPGMATHLHPLQCVSLSSSAANLSPQTLGDISLLRQVVSDISLPASYGGGDEGVDCVGGGEAWTRSEDNS